MRDRIIKGIYLLSGAPEHFRLEHRLFNAVSLLNGILNIAGAFVLLHLENFLAPFLLNFGSGILYLFFWYLSRYRISYTPLFWPFFLLTALFLGSNWITNGGSLGGAHYYLIAASLFAVILANNTAKYIYTFFLFLGVTSALFYVEYTYPGWISKFSTRAERYTDVYFNFIFIQIFAGVLVLLLSRNLKTERERSDALLLNILPEEIADKLKSGNPAEPRYYNRATVLFTDLVGFTSIAASMTPTELVKELDRQFSAFDAIIEKYHLEKIKTIGDSYMAVGGIPTENRTHALDCVLAGLEILRYIEKENQRLREDGKTGWEVRVGTHTGPLVAGVIGEKKFAYDVWGDTVNLASRMESSGSPGKLNVSHSTWRLVRRYVNSEHRGPIQAKNKGEVDMYFIHGLDEKYSFGSDNRLPSRQFFKAIENQRYRAPESRHESDPQ